METNDKKPVIDISGQQEYSAEALRQSLCDLQRFVIDTFADYDITLPADESCRHLAVLNWLTDDVEFTSANQNKDSV